MSTSILTGSDFAIAGAFAGLFTRFTCQPLDVLKIRFQLQTAPISRSSHASQYKSVIQAMQHITKNEGITAFWKGHIPGQWLSIVFGAVQFSSYEFITSYKKESTILHFAGGAICGISAVLASFPFDTVRTRLVAQQEVKIYKGTMHAFLKITQVEGFRSLFNGLLPACLHTLPLSALTFGIHHILITLWDKIMQKSQIVDPIPTKALVCGSIAGFCGKTIVYPLDLLKKRLQVQGMSKEPIFGLFNVFLTTVKHEGFYGLFKGFIPSVAKATVSTSIYFTSYDLFCKYLIMYKSHIL